jgi:ribonuclease P protein component
VSGPGHPPEARLRRREDFRRVLDRGDVFPGREAVVRRAPNGGRDARRGRAAPRAYGRAVRRNRFKRLVREAFRGLRSELGAHDYLVSPRRHLVRPTLEGLRADLRRTLADAPRPPRRRRPDPSRGPRCAGS